MTGNSLLSNIIAAEMTSSYNHILLIIFVLINVGFCHFYSWLIGQKIIQTNYSKDSQTHTVLGLLCKWAVIA